MPRRCAIIFLFLMVVEDVARPDEALYRFEGDMLPYDPTAGWLVFAVCDVDCTELVANGHFILEWAADGRDTVAYAFRIADNPELLPPTLWVEWRFRSNNPMSPFFYGCDAFFQAGYQAVFEVLWIHGDSIVSFGADYFLLDLPINEFRTYRFESPDGLHFRIAVDGSTFFVGEDFPGGTERTLQFGGDGGCVLMEEPTRNEWDYIRYGTIGDGEAIVASDPPAGIVETGDHPNLDRFTVTFDQPNYVNIDDVTVEVFAFNPSRDREGAELEGEAATKAHRHEATKDEAFDLQDSTFGIPVVVATRRRDNGPPETVEIVLDRPLAVGVTTRFTFDTGGSPNTVEYTLASDGACCLTNGACSNTTDTECSAQDGSFKLGASCSAAEACCLSSGVCSTIDPVCCGLAGGTVVADRSLALRLAARRDFGDKAPALVALSVAARKITPLGPPLARGKALCEGDADADGLDGACGDGCPNDPAKTSDGLCGCGVPDVDTDADTVPDCHDQCPGGDDRIDANANQIPDCAESASIPAASTWGLVLFVLLLLIAAKLLFMVRSEIDANASDSY